MLMYTDVRMEPNNPNSEYEYIINDDERLSDEEKEWRVNTSLYLQNKHKLWKPWIFGTIICSLIIFAIDGFITFSLVNIVIGFFINTPVAFVINGFQILANNKLRDIYNVNTKELRAQAMIESSIAFGCALSSFNTGRKVISNSMKSSNKKI